MLSPGLCIISCFRPCHSTYLRSTIYSQHVRCNADLGRTHLRQAIQTRAAGCTPLAQIRSCLAQPAKAIPCIVISGPFAKKLSTLPLARSCPGYHSAGATLAPAKSDRLELDAAPANGLLGDAKAPIRLTTPGGPKYRRVRLGWTLGRKTLDLALFGLVLESRSEGVVAAPNAGLSHG